MPIIISFASQKGGVGKSTGSRALAVEYTKGRWDVRIADMDTGQATSYDWNARRFANDSIKVKLAVQQYKNVSHALRDAQHADLLIIDSAPNSSTMTYDMAKSSDLIILPTGTAVDDLKPSVVLANNLIKKNIPQKKIAFLLSLVSDSKKEVRDAKAYIEEARYFVFDTAIEMKTGYKTASDEGKALTEATHKSSKKKAEKAMQEIIDHITKLTS